MANVILVGLEPAIANQLNRALEAERHWIQQKPHVIQARALSSVDIVFAGGKSSEYLALLRKARKERPALPFVVFSRVPDTKEWLDAIEAGATDYCSAPFEIRQIRWLMECAMPRRAHIGAAGAGIGAD